jgi:putative FmdB family regulatory protein
MPTYEYSCQSCGHEMEAFQRMSEDPLTDCPDCEKPSLKRKIGLGAGIIFKGGGFYETDFKEKKGKKPSKPASQSKDSEKNSSTPKKKESPAAASKD